MNYGNDGSLIGGKTYFGSQESFLLIDELGRIGYGGNNGKWETQSIGATQLFIPTASLATKVSSGPASLVILEDTGDNEVYANFILPENYKEGTDVVVGFSIGQTTNVAVGDYMIRAGWQITNPDVISANASQTITIPTALDRVGLLQTEYLSHVPSVNVEANGHLSVAIRRDVTTYNDTYLEPVHLYGVFIKYQTYY